MSQKETLNIVRNIASVAMNINVLEIIYGVWQT